MADRVVRVRLTAQVAEYVQGMEQAADSTRAVGDAAASSAERARAMDTVGKSMLAIGTIAAVAVGIAVSKFMEFDAAMSNVEAATNESADNMNRLREAALDAGARTVFSATEAANAIEELGKAGVSTQDILDGGLDGALDLAAAGGLGVAEAAGIAAVALKTFGLRGTDMAHVADLLAAGAGKAMGDVTDLSAALNQAGLVAEGTGLSIEETTAGLAAFASAGLLGSDAGTSFKSMLQRLTPQSAEAKSKMEELGISAYDAQGQFVGLSAFAGNLKDSLKSLTPEQRNAALAVIFGSDAVRAANVLYNEGAEGIDEWTTAVNDQGYASEQAAKRLDNLSGDVEALGGAFDTALIRTGSAANDSLRQIVQSATGVVDAIGDLPGPVLGVGLALGGVIAVIGLVGGAALVAIPKIAEFKAAMATLNLSGGRAALGLGLASGALLAAGVAFSIWAARQAEAVSQSNEFQDSLDKSTGSLTDYTRNLVAKKLAEKGAFEAAKEAGVSQKELTDAVIEGGDALDSVLKKFGDNNTPATFFSGVGIRAGNASQAVRDLNNDLNTGKENFKDQAAAADDSAKSLEEIQGVAVETSDAVNDLSDDIRNFGSAQFDVEESTAGLYEAFDALKENLDAGSASLDVTTEAGRQTQSAMLDTARAANENAAAIAAVGGTNDEIAGALNAGRQRIIDARIALGDSAEAAQVYADKLIATPATVQTSVTLNGTDAAVANLERVKSAIRDVINLIASTPVLGGNSKVSGDGSMGSFAYGGYTGPGPKFKAAGIVHADEFVSTTETLARPGNRAALEFMHAGGSIDDFAAGRQAGTARQAGADGYAGGGMYASDRYAAASVAAPQISFNAPIVTSNGTLIGMIQGVAGETVEFRLAQESDRSRAGARRI